MAVEPKKQVVPSWAINRHGQVPPVGAMRGRMSGC